MATLIQSNRAADFLRKPDHRLMKMNTTDGPKWFILPAGQISDATAQELLKRPDIVEFDDGLFPGNPQSWKIENPK